ncbi:MAG: hypothetical protein ABF647_09700, partial [Acetobacter orientalis]
MASSTVKAGGMGQQGSTEQAGQALPPQPGKQQNSVLKARHVSMISLGGVIGAGLFVGSGAAIATEGASVLLSYLLAGGIMFLVNVI